MLLVRDVIRFIGRTKRAKAALADLGVSVGAVARVIGIADGTTWLVDLQSPKLRISQIATADLTTLLECKAVELCLNAEGYDYAPIDGVITDTQRKRRDDRMAELKPILAQSPKIFDRVYRGHAVAAAARQPRNGTAATIHEALRRYWVYGMTPNAILPRYDRVGRSRNEANESKYERLGAGRKREKGKGANVTKEVRLAFEKATQRHYHANAKMSLKKTYDEAITDLATRRWVDPATKEICEAIDQNRLENRSPTYRQFRYWYGKSGRYLSDKEKRLGSARFQKDHRAVLGSASASLYGIGSRFEVDATILDVACVSVRDRRRFVGRPTLHLVTDVYSKMIVGFYLGFLESGWEVAGLAMRNALENKKKFCARYDIDIEEDVWPCAAHLPARILGDRGEYEGYNGTDFAAKTGVTIEVTAPYRGDMKGTVEKRFHMIHQLLTPMVPGAVTKNHAEKGDADYRRKAKLNLRELTQIIIRTILYLNNDHPLASHHRRAAMLDAGVPPIPREMWNWAMKSGRTELRRVRKDRIAFLMLPVDRAVVTGRGLKYKEIQYESETVRTHRWAELARAGKRRERPTISYDPSSTDQIYLHLEDGSFETCPISPVSERYAGIDFEEFSRIRESEKTRVRTHKRDSLGGSDVIHALRLRERGFERVLVE